MFRGIVFHRLKDWVKPQAAIVISALLFGIYHGNVVQFFYATCMGVMLAIIYDKIRNFVDQHRCTYSSKSVEPFRKQFLEQSVAADSGRNALQYYDRNFVMCDSDILVIWI